ncbi:MAG: peptidylprolyl isomerase [Planctomycetota bacterium]|jgi:cyclophilin family peptidyl-prolyl cis-trans isomerase|nr:peptidylprolyl isomerase [Planctomycetota bacterium]MDP6762688.1 peptidylprolyl isomerase [Planctomycetota bacterium]MDP6988940.1 peptidylprolyl isomerase [Planctomycetota bacterium]
MAEQHKQATDVTFAPTEEKEGVNLWLEQHWPKLAVLAVVISVGVLGASFFRMQEEAGKDESWDTLGATLEAGGIGILGDPVEIEPVLDSIAGTQAAPWAAYSLALSHAEEGEFEQAQAALTRLAAEHPEHLLASERFSFGEDSTPRTVVERLSRIFSDSAAFRAARPLVFANPEPAADAPRVRLSTAEGDIVVALYPDRAPEHVANFLKLCGEGYYDGTRFHRVRQSFLIAGGDPNTREGAPDTWGDGGPEYTLQPEESGLRHFAGALGAEKESALAEEASGSQFYVLYSPAHVMDERYTVFGQVVEGLEIVGVISDSPLSEGSVDRPEIPVAVDSATIL